MLRNPYGRYKWNRGTFNEGLIYKLKRFEDSEGIIIGFEEGNSNQNECMRDEKGYASRSQKKEGLKAADTLGKFILSWNGHMIKVGCGTFSHEERKSIWDNQAYHMGRFIKFRFLSHGTIELPRFALATGFRDEIDMEQK